MRRRLWLALALAGVTWSMVAWALDDWGSVRRATGPWDAIVVAGCRVDPDGLPSPALEWRVRLAVELWRAGDAPMIVFTGGLGTYPPSEAEASATLAESLGVPREAMVLEDRSTSTAENASRAAERLRVERIVVVTDAYHVFRARRVFDRYFPDVDAIGSTYGQWSRVRGAYREVLAVAAYGVRGDL